jgi:RNA polymerase sigma-70 factor (ECF subfamily)
MPDTKIAPAFAATRWTVVRHAARRDTTRARAALSELCRTYCYPLYAYVRRCGYSAADAEDLTQGYFARLLALDSLAAVSPEKGKFRSFLLAGMNHFLCDERDRAWAQRRDARRTIPFDTGSGETRYRHEPADPCTPERMFERQWALTLLETVVKPECQPHLGRYRR